MQAKGSLLNFREQTCDAKMIPSNLVVDSIVNKSSKRNGLSDEGLKLLIFIGIMYACVQYTRLGHSQPLAMSL